VLCRYGSKIFKEVQELARSSPRGGNDASGFEKV
jgi:hypothetical protein